MGRSRGFVSILNAAARSAARAQRQAEAQRRRQIRDAERAERHALRMQGMRDREARQLAKEREKEERQRHLDEQIEETNELNNELKEQLDELTAILEQVRSITEQDIFASLRSQEKFRQFNVPDELKSAPPGDLTTSLPIPTRDTYFGHIKPLSWFAGLFPSAKEKFSRAMQEAETAFVTATKKRDEWEAERLKKLKAFEEQRAAKIEALRADYEKEKQAFHLEVQKKNDEVEQLRNSYLSGNPDAIVTYNSVLLDLSEYPDEFPQKYRIAYVPEAKELALEYDLPAVAVIPAIADYRYAKSRDVIEEKPRKAQEIKDLYRDVVASVTLRTISEVFVSDAAGHIQVVIFNGFVQAVDPSTGKDIRPCLISVRTARERFAEIELKKIDKAACLRNLGAQVSPRPSELQAVKPIIEFDMIDKRFVEEGDILNALDTRPNLMELNPFEFETLVSNLFGKMGLESKLTRSSRDGGVDAVAFDARPVLGGKVVIQAKRYSNVVGVSAVRDLYGTMMNEGANKGILVTTSNYGPDAYDFAKDKPIELIDGGGLLYLLEQVGTKAKIIFLTEGQ